jgi:hypothetical protein
VISLNVSGCNNFDSYGLQQIEGTIKFDHLNLNCLLGLSQLSQLDISKTRVDEIGIKALKSNDNSIRKY